MIKFVKPLPVPEEMLGAYIEGRLSLEESHMIEDLINKSSDLSNLISDLCLPETSHSIYEDFPMFDTEFKLPETQIQIEPSTFDIIDTHTVSPNDFPSIASIIECELADISQDSQLGINEVSAEESFISEDFSTELNADIHNTNPFSDEI